eukprot:TRINITY_DN170_c0_g1_i1.p1 TRINITY_DN170_c0_g1~~TRINITY_DN170_c0_g1_i1.p1  ORF type:complete len:328 (-),score=65.28 TRINITY_DN170_c0_g1_i1:19-1002(-)
MVSSLPDIVYITCCALSFASSVTVLIVFFYKRYKDKRGIAGGAYRMGQPTTHHLRKRTRQTHIILARFVCMACAALSAFVPSGSSHLLCRIQGSLQIGFEGPSVTFLAIFVFFSFLIVVRNKKSHDLLKYRWIVHGVAWGIGVIGVVVTNADDAIQQNGTWCWIARDRVAYQFLFLYSWVVIAFLAILVSYYFIIAKIVKSIRLLRAMGSSSSTTRKSRSKLVLAAYPTIFFVLWLCPTIVRFAQSQDEDLLHNEWLSVLVSLTYIEGFVTSLLFAFVMEKWIPCRRKEDMGGESSQSMQSFPFPRVPSSRGPMTPPLPFPPPKENE